MEFVLRCNDLKCRAQLHDRAVVTTCSHVFCVHCADTTGLSQPSSGNRICPACQTQLTNPDDVVAALLNPAEDYKTSVLSGLSPTIIMECASRGLAFYSYQASQEVIYQEHVAKSLTEKYGNLSQNMDQLIHDANTQIKVLQEKLQAMQEEQVSLEEKNLELVNAFRKKSQAQQDIQKRYNSLKAQVMATQVANAAGEEVDYAINTVQSDRFIHKLPGTRSSMANLSQLGASQQRAGGRLHNRVGSGSSGSNEQQRGPGGYGIQLNPQIQARMLSGRTNTGSSAPAGTPRQNQRNQSSQLPMMGGARQNAAFNADIGPSYQASPMTRQPLVGSASSQNMNYTVPSKKTSMGNNGHFRR